MKTFSRSLFLFPLTILALAVSTAGCGHSSKDSSSAEKNRSADAYIARDGVSSCASMIGTTATPVFKLVDASEDCKPGPDGQALSERAPQITSVMLGNDPQRELKIIWTFDAPSQVEFIVSREIDPVAVIYTEITDADDRPSVLDTSDCWTLESGIKQCSYTETNLLPISDNDPSDVKYTYIVVAKNIDPQGSGEMSSMDYAISTRKSKRTAPPLGDPANIEDFRPQNLEGLRSADRTQITLSWDAPSNTADLETYIIERRHHQDGIRYFDLAEQTARTYVNTGLLANHHYSYRVFAKYPDGVSAAVNVGEYTNEPIPPTNVSAQWITETQINVSWAHSGENATGFIVERSLNSTSGFLPIPCAEGSDGNTRGCQDVNSPGNQLIPDTTYYYCVRTVNGSLASECSDSSPTTPEPLGPIMSFDPSTIDHMCDHGNSGTRTLTITNTGNANLNWVLADLINGNPEFITSVTPLSGFLAPAASQDLTVGYTCAGPDFPSAPCILPPALFTGRLDFEAPDADDASVNYWMWVCSFD